MRVEGGIECKNGGWLHRFGDNHLTEIRPRPAVVVSPETKLTPEECEKMMGAWSLSTNGQLDQLGRDLCLPSRCLRLLDCAWSHDFRAWAFPMRDEWGRMTGIRLRSAKGKKWAVRGSGSGLFIPLGAIGGRKQNENVFIAEGPTDTAALLSLGLFAVGRPACLGCERMILELFDILGNPPAVILSDNDQPGLKGAEKLQRSLKKCRTTVFCPPAKDIREFVNSGGDGALIDSILSHSLWTRGN